MEIFLERVLVQKAPALPEGLKKWLIKYIPLLWSICLVIGLTVISIFSWIILKVGSNASERASDVGASAPVAYSIVSITFVVGFILYIIFGVFQIFLIRGFLRRSRTKWVWTYRQTLIISIFALFEMLIWSSVLSIFLSSVAFFIICTLLLYILFQIKSYYNQ